MTKTIHEEHEGHEGIFGAARSSMAEATRGGISGGTAGGRLEPIVRVEDHLHAILPDLDAVIPRLHRMFR